MAVAENLDETVSAGDRVDGWEDVKFASFQWRQHAWQCKVGGIHVLLDLQAHLSVGVEHIHALHEDLLACEEPERKLVDELLCIILGQKMLDAYAADHGRVDVVPGEPVVLIVAVLNERNVFPCEVVDHDAEFAREGEESSGHYD